MEYYAIVIHNADKDEDAVFVLKSRSYFDAEEAVNRELEKWTGFTPWSITHLDKARIESGEMVCVY